MKLFVSAFIILGFSVAGCSSKPTESDGKKVVETKYSSCARVTSFQKTNGQTAELMGVKMYNMDYEADIEYTKNGIEGNFMGRFSGFTEKENPQPMDKIFGVARKKGERSHIKGSISFEMTEKGWRSAFP